MDDYAGVPRAGDILIADDDVALRTVLTDLLRFEGYTIREAFNATEALMEITNHPPALLFLDITMPMVSGIEVFHQLRRAGQSFPIIIITGSPERARSLIEQYQVICMQKPLDLTEVLAYAAKYVQRARTA